MTRSDVRVAVSWFCIVVAVLLIQYTVNRSSSNEQSADTSSIMQLQMTGKYYVGAKQIAAQNPVLEKRLFQLEKDILNNLGRTNHLSGIPLIAELAGREEALNELKRMASDPDKIMDGKNLPLFYQLYHDGGNSLDSDQVGTLKKYGWIGRLALTQDKPDSDPERKAVLQSAFRMVMLVGLLTILGVAVIVGGLVLLVIAIVQVIKRKITSHLVMPERPGDLLLETFAIYLVLTTSLPLLFMMVAPEMRYGGIAVSILAGLIPITWPLLQGSKWKDYRDAIGWHRGRGIFREVGAGIAGYIGGLPLMVLALVVVMMLVKYTGKTPSHPVVFDLSRKPLYLFLLACVYAPFVEETLFRGALYGYLRRNLSWAGSAVISGFIFAVLHPQGWVAVPAIGTIGFNLSAIREWRGSAIAPMTAHALNNGSLLLILVISLA